MKRLRLFSDISEPEWLIALKVEGAQMALKAAAEKLATISNQTTDGHRFVFEADQIVAALDAEKIARGK